jgi:KaiC/GvpD/RAD55 family RecA-like ATPase
VSKLYTLHELAAGEQQRILEGRPLDTGLPSGIALERLVPGGIPRDKLTAVFSDEGTFKTTLITQMQYTIADIGPVVNISLEDSSQLCAHRMLGRASGVNFGRIHGGILDEAEKATVAAAELSSAMRNMYIVDDLEPTIDRCFDAALAVPGCRALFVDYIQLLEGPGDQKTVLENASKSAARFAKDHKIAVVFVSQRKTIDLEGARKSDPRPVTADMFGSSAMRMCVKLAVGIFRPSMWCPVPTLLKGAYAPYTKWLSANPAHMALYPNLLEVHVTKQVCGPPGAFNVLVEPSTGVIKPYDMRSYL